MIVKKDYDFARHTIQDPIHGAITFGSIEKAIIDHPLFQRLHGLRQNSLLYLIFPSANHTRFDHSVGVMWLASKFLLSVIAQQRHIIEQGVGRTSYQAAFRVDDHDMALILKDLQEDPYCHILMRASALFHDIGHGPFSHLFDYFFPNATEMLAYCSEASFKHINPLLAEMHRSKPDESVKHEFFSCLIATQVLWDRADVLARYGIDAEQMVFDVCAIIDASLQPSTNLCKRAYSIHTLLHDIVSGEVDADRMDYLLRDSHMSGVNYGLYDPNRIHKSMCAYADIGSKSLRLGLRYSGLGAVEDS